MQDLLAKSYESVVDFDGFSFCYGPFSWLNFKTLWYIIYFYFYLFLFFLI
jgi:hypothetical protein